MCPENRNVCVLTIDLNQPLETHDQMVGRLCYLIVAPIFSGVLVVLYSDLVNPIFRITLMIFFEVLPRDLCDGLDFIPTSKTDV